MDFKQVIEASATVIRITELKKDDVVKLIDEKDSNDAQLTYGIVEDVLNDGENGYVQFATMKKDYYGVSFDRRLLAANSQKQPAIFPATSEEVKTYFDGARKTLVQKIADAEKALSEANGKLVSFDAVRLNENRLTTPSYAA